MRTRLYPRDSSGSWIKSSAKMRSQSWLVLGKIKCYGLLFWQRLLIYMLVGAEIVIGAGRILRMKRSSPGRLTETITTRLLM